MSYNKPLRQSQPLSKIFRQLTEQLNQLKEFADAIAANKSIGNTLLAKLNELTQELTAIKTALKTDFVAIVKKAEGGA